MKLKINQKKNNNSKEKKNSEIVKYKPKSNFTFL